jgi:hypothetical protein
MSTYVPPKQDTLAAEDMIIDLGGVGASYSSDTITISGIDMSSGLNYSTMNTITMPSTYTGSYGTVTTSSGGAGLNWNNNYTINGGGLTDTNATVKITGNGLDLDEGADIKIGHKSLKEFMSKMEERMAILVPDPAKLEKFQALKKAYEHYKTLESLCFNEPEEDEE